MQTFKISGETPFRSNIDSFSVGATSAGYTLSYSADKVTWTDYTSSTPAGENLMVVGCTPEMWFKLKNNVDTETVVIL